MNIEERLTLFHELVTLNYAVDLWCYTPELKLLYTTCPPESATHEMISLIRFPDALTAHIQSGNRAPIIVDTDFRLAYVFAFDYHLGKLQSVYMLGPVFVGQNSHLILKKELNRHNLSVALRTRIFHQFEQIPIIPNTQLFQYTIMFHCCVTGERISTSEIHFPENDGSDTASDVSLISEEHRGIWLAEQQMMQMFREGNPDYKKALAHSGSLSTGVKFNVGDSLRKSKNDLLVLLTLCSRASIEGGLSPSVAYTLNDYYAQKIEECSTSAALMNLSPKMTDDYIRRVQKARKSDSVSRQIQSICEYIGSHLGEKLAIADLADRAGYTEYYFSHKFKKEVGVSVSEYILRKKVELAKQLLCASRKDIQEISGDLGFASRSYFSSSFQKITGMSPKEYREKNLKL